MMGHDEPLYAVIAMLGGHFTVVFKAKKGAHGSVVSCNLSGSSEENVLGKYRGCGVPLVDMRTCGEYRGISKMCEEAYGCKGPGYLPLEKYLEQYRAMGATIGVL